MESEKPVYMQQIYKSILAVMADLEPIGKDRRNDQQQYRFRGIEDCYNALNPLFSKHGIFTVPRVIGRTKEVYANKSGGRMVHVSLSVEYDFVASDGSKITVGPIDAEGSDMSDKASNKAMSAAHKYAFIQLFAIPTEDMEDSDRTTVPFPPVEQPKQKAAPAARPVAKSAAPSSPGDYVVTFGKKYSGKKLSEISDADLASFMTYIESESARQNKPITGAACEFMVAADAWLRRFEEKKGV